MSNGYFIAAFGENVKIHKYLDFGRIFYQQGSTRVWEKFQFSPLLAAILDFSGK